MNYISNKPLGMRAYGSIPHLPGSRMGPKDEGISPGQAAILTEQRRDDHDVYIFEEKLDGSCVAVAKLNGELVPLIRAGYRATQSFYPQHHAFHDWVIARTSRFDQLLKEGERCVGEWLLEAHGTLYDLQHEPFVIFDLMTGHDRVRWAEKATRIVEHDFVGPRLLSYGRPRSVDQIVARLATSDDHGAVGGPEGFVGRVERNGKFDFIAKWVRADKIDGKYMAKPGEPPVYNKMLC